MKKALAILLALALLCSLGVSAFAASDTVSGTLKDGTVVEKPVGEVLLSAADAVAKNDALAAFFDKANGYSSTLSTGAVDFGGAFADIVESTVDVPLRVSGAKAGDALLVTLSDGSVSGLTCEESGVVVAAFPKDAAGIGYYVSSVTADWGDLGIAYPVVMYEQETERRNEEYGMTLVIIERLVANGPENYTLEASIMVHYDDGSERGFVEIYNGTAIYYDDEGTARFNFDSYTDSIERSYTYGDGSYYEVVYDENYEAIAWGHYDPNGSSISPGPDPREHYV